jgi:superfamily II DNA or RNA helicase
MLLEMATGTGKTLTIAMLMKRWFQAAVISRVLFLADRIELAKQAKETFDDYLRDWPSKLLYGWKRSLEGQIVIGTLDTIAGQLGSNGFGHGYFDLVVTDECHRSIYNTHRATLAHFDAIHIGLTATPNPGELRWISNHERQLVKSAYMFFDCWDSAKQEGMPTFSYTIQEGIRDKFLADYKIYSAESRLTFEGAKWADRILELYRDDPAVQKIFAGNELTEEEWDALTRRLNSPEYYFDEKTLRKAFEQPTGSLTDFIRAALGQYKFPSREERIRSVFNTWVAEHSGSIMPDHTQMLRLLESRVLAGDKIEMRLFSLPPFSLWGGRVRMEQIFGRENLVRIVDELNMLLTA